MKQRERIPVSVVIPCNSMKFTEQSLRSVFSQSVIADEIILVTTRKIRDGLSIGSRRKVRVLIRKSAKLVDALNQGCVSSENQLIARFDSDDIMSVTRLEKQYAFLQKNPDYVVVGGQMHSIDETGNLLEKIKYPLEDMEIRRALNTHNPLPHPGVMFRKDLFLKVGMYRPAFEYVEDWDLWVRMSAEGKLANLSSCVVHYRKHPNQVTKVRSQELNDKVVDISISRNLRIFGLSDLCPEDPTSAERKEWRIASTQILKQYGMRTNVNSDYQLFKSIWNDFRRLTKKEVQSNFCLSLELLIHILSFLVSKPHRSFLVLREYLLFKMSIRKGDRN